MPILHILFYCRPNLTYLLPSPSNPKIVPTLTNVHIHINQRHMSYILSYSTPPSTLLSKTTQPKPNPTQIQLPHSKRATQHNYTPWILLEFSYKG